MTQQMSVYRLRACTVQAVQWQPGKTVDGLTEHQDSRGVYAKLVIPGWGVAMVEPGDWIVRAGDKIGVSSNWLFKRDYEPIEEASGAR